MELYIKPRSDLESDSPMEDSEPMPTIPDEPAPKPEPDNPMEDTSLPIEPPPPLPPPKEWKPYEPTGGRYLATYALKHGEQLTEPWKQFHAEAGPSTVEKRPVSLTSKVSTPKHFIGSEKQTILSTPAYVTLASSVPPTPNLSAPPSTLGSAQRHTVALPFGYSPHSRLPELPLP